MKTCPVCKTALFDDMEVCYGCMHRFADDGAVGHDALSGAGLERAAIKSESTPLGRAAVLSQVEDRHGICADADALWVIRLEVGRGKEPGQTWSVELTAPCAPTPKGGSTCACVPPDEDNGLSMRFDSADASRSPRFSEAL